MDISLWNCGETCSKTRKTVSHRKCTEVRIFMRPGWKHLPWRHQLRPPSHPEIKREWMSEESPSSMSVCTQHTSAHSIIISPPAFPRITDKMNSTNNHSPSAAAIWAPYLDCRGRGKKTSNCTGICLAVLRSCCKMNLLCEESFPSASLSLWTSESIAGCAPVGRLSQLLYLLFNVAS